MRCNSGLRLWVRLRTCSVRRTEGVESRRDVAAGAYPTRKAEVRVSQFRVTVCRGQAYPSYLQGLTWIGVPFPGTSKARGTLYDEDVVQT